MERIPITKEGYERLKKELETLETVERRKVIKAIAEARAHGDLSENAEFAAAKERQGFVEGRIRELHFKLSHSEIIDCSNLSKERVIFGSVVALINLETEEEVAYQLVGPDESDVPAGKISVLSPLGRALISKEEGDEIPVRTPSGVKRYEILEIR